MTNYEKYKDAIIETLASSSLFALVKGEPTSCYKIDCKNCDFRSDEKHGGCPEKMREWFNAEYVEQPNLTEQERAFLVALCPDFKYIARNKCKNLSVFQTEPRKNEVLNMWENTNDGFGVLSLSPEQKLFNIAFKFIKWEDEKPWKILDLLKLEVE